MISKLLKQQETVYQFDGEQRTNYKTVKCHVPQGPILGPPFILGLLNLYFASDLYFDVGGNHCVKSGCFCSYSGKNAGKYGSE